MVCTTDVLNGKNCLKRSLFDQNFALQGLYFDQNFEKCTLVAGHFILNQIFKNLQMSQKMITLRRRADAERTRTRTAQGPYLRGRSEVK